MPNTPRSVESMPISNLFRPIGPTPSRDRAFLARRLARAAGGFELRLLGRAPRSIAVVAGGGCTVVTMHIGLSAIERGLVATAAGQRRVLAWHRALAEASFEEFRDHLLATTGVDVRCMATHVDAPSASLLKTCTTAAGVDVVVLGDTVPGFGLAIDEHVFIDNADGPGPVPRGFHPEGFQTMKKVSHVGANEEESRERGDWSA
jgi:uncharacterized protein YbcI